MSDGQEYSLKIRNSALAAAEDVPENMRETFLLILAYRHREAADMIEAEAKRGKN